MRVISNAVNQFPENPVKYFEGKHHSLRKEPSTKTEQHGTIVSSEVRNAGEALRLARVAHGVELSEIASDMNITDEMLDRFERGEVADINPNRLYQTAAEFIDTEDEHMKRFRNQIEILNWLRTFIHIKKLAKKSFLGRGIRFLRYASHKTSDDFADILGIAKGNLLHLELGERSPDPESLNNIFQASVLNELGTDNKAMQYMRLQSRDTNATREDDDEPMTLERLKMCEIGDLGRYIRRLRGFTQSTLARELNYSRTHIEHFETGDRVVNEDFLESFITWCGFDKSDNALAQILRRKAKKSDISEDLLQQALTGQYLFKEYLDQLDPYPLSDSDEDIQPWLKSMGNSKRIRFLRKRNGWSQATLAQNAGVNTRTIMHAETGNRVTKDIVLLKIAKAFGYEDIHNPILISFLEDAARERAA